MARTLRREVGAEVIPAHDRWMDGSMELWMDGSVEGFMDGWMDGWMDG
jgi:hypothetical protein